MIDNFDRIRKLLVFDDKDLFYFVQVLQRKKENPQIGSNSRVIKDYFIGSLDRFNELEDEIKQLSTQFNARAMIRLNRRSYEQTHLKTIEKLVNQLLNKDYTAAKHAYSSVCGTYHKEADKTWILDIDEKLNDDRWKEMAEYLEQLLPEGKKLVTSIPSRAGEHFISRPFDVKSFKEFYPEIEIHKDNPTNLFIP